MQPWHLWTIAGICLLIAEMLTVSFFAASFGVAALVTALREVGVGFEAGSYLDSLVDNKGARDDAFSRRCGAWAATRSRSSCRPWRRTSRRRPITARCASCS
jgi:hypothetical protein